MSGRPAASTSPWIRADPLAPPAHARAEQSTDLTLQKMSVLDALRAVLLHGRFPLIPEDREQLVAATATDDEFVKDGSFTEWMLRNSVDLFRGDKTGLAMANRYLEDRQPEERLDELEESLSTLRTSLEANFTITDILLDVRQLREDE